MNVRHMSLPDYIWTPTGPACDRAARLRVTFTVNGCDMHLEAHAVEQDENGLQSFTAHDSKEEQDAFYVIASQAVETLTIGGREYVLVAYPFGA